MDFNPFHLGQAFVNSALSAGRWFGSHLDLTGSQAQQREYNYDLALHQQTQGFNSQEAQKDRDWQERMSNTARRTSCRTSSQRNIWIVPSSF